MKGHIPNRNLSLKITDHHRSLVRKLTRKTQPNRITSYGTTTLSSLIALPYPRSAIHPSIRYLSPRRLCHPVRTGDDLFGVGDGGAADASVGVSGAVPARADTALHADKDELLVALVELLHKQVHTLTEGEGEVS